nr:uncharacterized protein LOC122272265 [Parasteatoda tepidariorum]
MWRSNHSSPEESDSESPAESQDLNEAILMEDLYLTDSSEEAVAADDALNRQITADDLEDFDLDNIFTPSRKRKESPVRPEDRRASVIVKRYPDEVCERNVEVPQ